MVRALFRRRWVKALTITATVVGGWMLFAYAANLPIEGTSSDCCAVCRESSITYIRFGLPIWTTTRGNGFSRFFLEHADPRHRHSWVGSGTQYVCRDGAVAGCGCPAIRLPYRPALDILKALPDDQSRKQFFENQYDCYLDFRTHGGNARVWKNAEAIEKLIVAYAEDHNRRDWLELLRSVGLYPKSANVKPTTDN